MRIAWLFLWLHANIFFLCVYFRAMSRIFIIRNSNQMPWVIIPGL